MVSGLARTGFRAENRAATFGKASAKSFEIFPTSGMTARTEGMNNLTNCLGVDFWSYDGSGRRKGRHKKEREN